MIGSRGEISNHLRESLADEYSAALREFVAGGSQHALTRAFLLGRRGIAEGMGVLDLAAVHNQALSDMLSGDTALGVDHIVRAGQFLIESLSPYELTLRAFQANARLLGLNETLARQNSEIDHAREQLRTILDATTAIIYLKDTEGRFLFVNLAFQRVFGVHREHVVGRMGDDVLPARVAEPLHASDGEVLAGGTPQEVEETYLGEDGLHTFLSLKFPLLDASGTPYGLCCVATDITKRKHRDDELRRAIEAAEFANRELEAFSYSVAHDLRAPLRSIDGFSQALLEDCAEALDTHGHKYLRYVRESAQHMAHLIDDLLALSRVARSDLDRTVVDLSATCRKIAERLLATEPERQVAFTIQEGVTADGDPRLLRALFENLIGNAWKFTSKTSTARIEFGVQGEHVPPIYYVRDDGAGFDMAYAGKLFGVFQRLHRADQFEGTGIGLATVQRIVRRHGGRVWAEGVVDRGATFYFTLEEEVHHE